FERGHIKLADDLREGRPSTATSKDNIRAVRPMIKTDKRHRWGKNSKSREKTGDSLSPKLFSGVLESIFRKKTGVETLESARKAAGDSQYSSTAEMVGRGYRSRKISSPVRRALNLKKKPNIISRSDDDFVRGDQEKLDCCLRLLRKNCFDKYPSFDKNEFSKAGTNWFRLGNQRAGSQPKQMLKKMASAQTNADATERNSPPAGN
ncbi:hypothetical protein EVAR_94258_1, partial [Eumeta japonica]